MVLIRFTGFTFFLEHAAHDLLAPVLLRYDTVTSWSDPLEDRDLMRAYGDSYRSIATSSC